jgi:mRNA interferase MazF
LVVAALPGDFGKPRPALVVQADAFDEQPTVVVLAITSHLVDAPRLRIDIGAGGGLSKPSQIQIDKPMAIRRARVGPVIGKADRPTMAAVDRALVVFLGLA